VDVANQSICGGRSVIPSSYIQEWFAVAPWPDSSQIEQDLIISRAICDLFNSPALAGKIAFRGGTAINLKLIANGINQAHKSLLFSRKSSLEQSFARCCSAGRIVTCSI
jgi:hypothetical protein